MTLHPIVTNFAPCIGYVCDIETYTKAAEEGGEYVFRKISPDFFLCEHGENAYVIAENIRQKMIGCSCEAMNYRKTPLDVCKHIIAFTKQDMPIEPISEEQRHELEAAGWTGKTLRPPDPPKKKRQTPLHDPERKPTERAATREERRKLYESMTAEEMCRIMPDAELRNNARRGGVAAIAELKRREAEQSA